MSLFAFWEWTVHLPLPVALAAVATLGYVIGKRSAAVVVSIEEQHRRDLKRAQQVAKELEKIAESVRQHLAAHHASIVEFKDRVFSLGTEQNEPSWHELRKEAESMIKPTMKLATQLASAYDEIRQQTGYLMSFTEVRTDPLTRVSNRRALDEYLASHFALMNRYKLPFSIVIFDIDHFKHINDEQGHAYGDSLLASVARVLADSVRDTDLVTRYGGEEFVVVMPQTMLEGGCIFANRLRERIETTLPLTISGGVAAAADGDNSQSLLARADAALYGAKAAGRNRVFFHNGPRIQPYPPLLTENGEDPWNSSASEDRGDLAAPAHLVGEGV
ncbi:MAG: diguanylate cyclase [Pirellulales bacterium]